MKKLSGDKDIKNNATPARSRFRCGIYGIVHISTGRTYVGQASEVERRWSVHKFWLRKGQHHCTYLQRAWNKYGETAFAFVFLELTSTSRLNQGEIRWFKKYDGKLFNIHPPGKSARGWKMSAEAVANIRTGAIRRAKDPKERKIRSLRAKRQHALGQLRRKVLPIQPRACVKCKKLFRPIRLPNGMISRTKWCNKCRPPHYGGFYKTARHW